MSANHPLISIIVPVFNSAQWIEETLRSVTLQTYPRASIEVIIVDDGSTDDSLEIAASLLKEFGINGKTFRTSNAGPSAARNTGWTNAKGDWIQFLDSDDILAPEKLAIQLEAGSRAGKEVAGIFSSWSDLKLRDGSWQRDENISKPHLLPSTLVDLLRAKCFIHCGAVIFRRSWLEQVGGFNEAFRLIEDVDLLLRLKMAGAEFERVASTNPLFLYRRRQRSLSTTDGAAFVQGCLRNAIMVEDHLRFESNGIITEEQADVLLEVYGQAARFYFEADREEFRKIYTRMLALKPSYYPSSPTGLRFLSTFLGYPRAESLALTYRRVKRLLLAPVSR